MNARQLFRFSGFQEDDTLALAGGDTLKLRELPAFLRVLLTTDGTVTKSLESYFWEAVGVERCHQGLSKLESECEPLDIPSGAEVLNRHVRLQGKQSERIYAWAQSILVLARLPETLAKALLEERIGIGELVRESGLETYRELLEIGRECIESQECISRTYRIFVDGAAAIQVTEYFPLRVFERP